MNWDMIGAMGELVGAAAVVVTLAYLAVQLRQNTKAVRVSSAQAVTEELQNMFNLLTCDQELAEIFTEASTRDELTGARKVRYYTFNSNILRVYENAYLQRQQDVIDDAHWDGMTRMMIDYTKMASFATYWTDRKHWLSEGFQEYMDSEIIPGAPKAGVNIPGNY